MEKSVDKGRRQLSSWKEIAAYLGRDARTAIRWERDRGLPVHRVPGGKGQRVFAYTDELDRWLRQTPVPESPESKPAPAAGRRVAPLIVVAAGALLLLTTTMAASRIWLRGDVVRVRFDGQTISAFDESARHVWQHRLPAPIENGMSRHGIVLDIDQDTRADVLVSASTVQPGGSAQSSLLLLDHRGKLRWQRSFDDEIRFNGGVYGAPWYARGLTTVPGDHGMLAGWVLQHHTWWPGLVALFDSAGGRTARFVNAGWITALERVPTRPWLVTAGFSNSRDAAAFAVIDPKHANGASPEDPGSPYECRDCGADRPVAYVVVGWTDVAEHSEIVDRIPSLTTFADGSIQLRAVQGRGVECIVEMSPRLHVVRRSLSDSFWQAHRALELRRLITHSRETCPHRDGPPVRLWTPANGWTTLATP
jgi:hypothetical protein